MSSLSSPELKASNHRRLVAIIAAVVVSVDAITKVIAAHALAGKGVVNLLGGRFHLELYRNHAGPGNILTGHPVLVSLFSIAAVIAIAVAGWSVRRTTYAIAVGLLLGGGIGNLVDRIFGAPGPLRGGVIDWIKPTLSGGSMNLSDLAINAAIIVLVIGALLEVRDGWQQSRVRPSEINPN